MTWRRTIQILLGGVLAGALAVSACSTAPNGGNGNDGGTTSDGGTVTDGGTTSDGGTTTDGGTTGPSQPCAQTTALTTLPVCGNPSNAAPIYLPKGCIPTVDGTVYKEEWDGSTCVQIATDVQDVSGNNFPMQVYMKYTDDAVYVALSGTQDVAQLSLYPDPDDSDTMGDELAVVLHDDGTGRYDMLYQGGNWTFPSSPIAGVEVAGTSIVNDTEVVLEYKIPFSVLCITAGQAHSFRLGVAHRGTWPTATSPDFGASDWGQISAANGTW